MAAPRVVPVPCLSDNYAYLVHVPGSKACFVVDPSEAAPVEAALAREGLDLVAVLATHHHFDHVGGNEDLVKARPGLPVIASAYDKDRVPAITRTVNDGETFEVAGLPVRTLAVPGHTLGAVAYVVEDAVFTGDTMFVAGCGRLFEGTPAQMFHSLCEVLAVLPPATRVYCGHEYTLANARFAATLEPDNEDVKALIAQASQAAGKKEPTVPSTMVAELRTNPFLRVREKALRVRYGSDDPVAVLAATRKDKDAFRA